MQVHHDIIELWGKFGNILQSQSFAIIELLKIWQFKTWIYSLKILTQKEKFPSTQMFFSSKEAYTKFSGIFGVQFDPVLNFLIFPQKFN